MSDDYGSTQRLDRDSSTSASRSAASRDNTDRKPDSFCVRWRWWIRPTIITVYMLFVLFALPLLIYNSIKDGFQRNDQLVLIAGLSVLATIPMSVWHIVQHMLHYTKPVLQKHIVRILWMVPIYALNAFLGLIFYEKSFYMDCMREMYEAYVIYNFMGYLLNYLNLEMDLERSLELKPQQPHIFPLCYMQPWRMGRDFVHNCKHGILQYTVLRLFTTLVAIVCEGFDVYQESTFKWNVAYPYIVAINNMSQFTAMYCLVLFYKANKEELSPMRPLPMFLCIKAIIFFSFFQSVIITFLVYFGYVHNIFGATSASDADYKNLSSKLQDFLICIEMFVAALAHKYSFPHGPFHINIPNYTVSTGDSWFQSCWAMCDVSDVRADVSDHFGVLGSSMVRRLRGQTDYEQARGVSSQFPLLSREDDRLLSGRGSASNAAYHSARDPEKPFDPNEAAGSSAQRPHTARHYGTVNAGSHMPDATMAAAPIVVGTHINIVGRPGVAESTYSPQYGGGAPRQDGQFFGSVGLGSSSASFLHDYEANKVRNARQTNETTSTSVSTGSSLTNRGGAHHRDVDTFTGLTTGAEGGLHKSDSAASDWLSTPTDEMVGIDVSGPDQQDLIRLRPDPKA